MTETMNCIDCEKVWAKPEPTYCCDECGCYTCAECHEVDEDDGTVMCSGCKQSKNEDEFEDCDCGYTHHPEDTCPMGKECEKYERWCVEDKERECEECHEDFTPSVEHKYDAVCDECVSEKGKTQRTMDEDEYMDATHQHQHGDVRKGEDGVVRMWSNWRNEWITKEQAKVEMGEMAEIIQMVDDFLK